MFHRKAGSFIPQGVQVDELIAEPSYHRIVQSLSLLACTKKKCVAFVNRSIDELVHENVYHHNCAH